MWKTISTIFGSSSVIDSGMRGIDAMVFTDEERSKHKLALLKLYEPYKLAQRIIAILFSLVFLFVFLLAVIIWIIGAFTTDLERAGFLMSVAFELSSWNIKTLGTAISLIIGFYFAGGLIEGSIIKHNESKR